MITGLLKKAKLLLWFLPGFLLWASFPPMAEKTDVFFALAPIMMFARRKAPGRSFSIWFSNGLFFWVATLAWMPAIVKNGGPWPLVILGWGALSAYCALYFGAFGFLSSSLWRWTRPRGYGWRLFAIFAAEPILWAGLEIVRSRLFGGFAWNQLGVAPVNAHLGSPAALGGVYLVSALVVLVNGTFVSIAERMFAQFLGDRPPAGGALRWARSMETLVPLLAVLSVYRISNAAGDVPRETALLRAGLVQRDSPSVFDTLSGVRENPYDRYSFLFSALCRSRPELLVLPESALAEVGFVDSPLAAKFAGWAMDESGASAIVAGGSRRDVDRLYNSAGLFTSASSRPEGFPSLQIYDKVHLVPFGEFIPCDKIFPVLQRLAPVGSCTPGELKTLELPSGTKLGVAICYEDTDSAQIRALAASGAQALVFITNDNWFSDSTEPLQHAWQSVARAVETGLPVIRAGNNGVTGSVSADGRVSWLREPGGDPLVDDAGTICAEIDVPDSPGGFCRRQTVYVLLGDAPLLCAFLVLLTAMSVVKYATSHE